MRFLIVFCHPNENSFGAALYNSTCESLTKSNHEIKTIDLYREGFNPVLSPQEWNDYLNATEKNIAGLKNHVDDLLWAEGLILIFPTWMYGPPALLKGWLERVWLPNVAFEIPKGKQRIARGKLKHIRRFCVVTTSGSPHWWLWFIGDPAKSMLFRGYKILFSKKCKLKWFQLYNMNHSTAKDRKRYLDKVSYYFSRIN